MQNHLRLCELCEVVFRPLDSPQAGFDLLPACIAHGAYLEMCDSREFDEEGRQWMRRVGKAPQKQSCSRLVSSCNGFYAAALLPLLC